MTALAPLRTLFAAPVVALCLALASASPVAAEAQVPQNRAQVTLSFVPVVKEAAPAVVNIFAKQVVQQQSPFAGDPFFSELFRELGPGRPRVQNSLGSGVILSSDGLVVSNYHVVGQATQIRVALNDRREFAAHVVLADKRLDLAVLKLEGAQGLPSLALRNSDTVEVGELVLAIGNPFGIGQTVSNGIISGLARSGLSFGGRGYFIQTDAAINPGNSGGALVGMGGRLVGINSSILTRSGGSNGIGFAIPSNLVAQFLAQAKAGARRFQRPWTGAKAQSVDASLAESLGLDRPEGVLLSAFAAGSPLAEAGLGRGDVVLSIDGFAVNSPQEMQYRLMTLGVGARAQVSYLHRGTRRSASLALKAPPEVPQREAMTITSAGNVFAGLSLSRINPAVIEEMGLPENAHGVVVTRLAGYALHTGMKVGDVILAINGQDIQRPAEVAQAGFARTPYWDLRIYRGGRVLPLEFSY
ncbi:trypsin-like peptidase domain-containing protein [Acidimangrovimonas sediminis]|uniref:trypsin-like peptidase domain-containing protein n=1 Tax=Acidimangrovimonas sediminis TaxID=2056283 RepID=UPI000C7FC695|nr:trypsin-like peptidase domain-containing protein [Acidimangrovimonas sediminis]